MEVPRFRVLKFAVVALDGDALRELFEVDLKLVLLRHLTVEMIGCLTKCAVVELQKPGRRREINPRVHPICYVRRDRLVIIASALDQRRARP